MTARAVAAGRPRVASAYTGSVTQSSGISISEPRFPRMTYEEYLDADWLPERTEWVDGEVIESMTVSESHARLVGWLHTLLFMFVDRGRRGRLFLDPFNMKVSPQLPGRAPDILFLRNENLSRVRPNHLEGPADLVVEVISPGTEATDRGDKYYEYEAGGVREYWLLDPARETAEFFLRDAQGYFRPAALVDGVSRSRELEGFWLRPEWPFTLPPVHVVLDELLPR